MDESFPSHGSLDNPIETRQPPEGFNIQDPVISSITTYSSRRVAPSGRESPWPSLQIEPANQTNQTPLIDRGGSEEVDRHEYTFNKRILLTSSIYYTLYYFGLWLPLSIFQCFSRCPKRWPILYNLNHRTNLLETMVSFIGLFVPCGFLSFIWKDFEILVPLVIALWINTIFVIVSQVAIVAYTNQRASNLILTKTLNWKEMKSLKKIEISNQETELRDTFNRLNINVSHLYFSYMDDSIREITKIEVMENNDAEPENNMVEASMFAERARFERCLAERTSLDGEKLFGYDLAFKLLKNIKEPPFKAYKSRFYWLGILVAIGLAFTEYYKILHSPSKWKELLLILALLFILSFLITVLYILEITYIGTSNLRRRKRFMRELENLITLGRSHILNIFDEMSLTTWMVLRKIFMHYGDRQMEIMSLIISGFIGLYIIAVIAFFASHFGDSHILDDSYSILELLNIGVIYLVMFVGQIIYLALSINQQFNIHRGLIRTNRNKAVEMYRLYPYYSNRTLRLQHSSLHSFEEQALRFLKKKFPIPINMNQRNEQQFKEVQDKTSIQEERLKEVYDDTLCELKFEEKTHPIKLAEIKMTPKLVIALVAPLGSALCNAIFSLF